MRGARFLPGDGVRLQLSLNDCGPTALGELLELSGLGVPPSDSLRRLTSMTALGTTLERLASAAALAGLEVLRLHWDPADLPLLPIPSLVWVERNHFVVVARRGRADSLEIYDPATGRYRITSRRFARLWSGDALVPLDSISPRRKPDGRPGARPLRLRGTRATWSRTMEV